MWALWFYPLTFGMLIIGTLIALTWYFASPTGRRPRIVTVLAIPFGFALLPIFALVGFALLLSGLQKSDSQLYEELFGYRQSTSESAMLFDDFGFSGSREIYMRIQPDSDDRRKLMTILSAVQSEYTLAEFIRRGDRHGFSWWLSANPRDSNYCSSARIFDVHGFRGWKEFRAAQCLDAGKDFPASHNLGSIYVIASRRAQ